MNPVSVSTTFTLTPMSDDDIRSSSTLEIKSPEDLISLKLGPQDQHTKCATCNNFWQHCWGHMSYISLQYPIFNPILWPRAFLILKHTCVNCLRYQPEIKNLCTRCHQRFLTFEFDMIDDLVCRGLLVTRRQAQNIYRRVIDEDKQFPNQDNEKIMLSPDLVNRIFYNFIVNGDLFILGINPKLYTCFMLKTIPIPTIQTRISQPQIDRKSVINIFVQKLLNIREQINKIKVTDSLYMEIDLSQQHYWTLYHGCCFLLMSNKAPPELQKRMGRQKFDEPISLIQAAQHKTGFLRQDINGTRTDYSSRTVVTGNPEIDCRCVVCPLGIAMKQYVQVHVGSVNMPYLRALIKNFPHYPCVTQINQGGKLVKVNDYNKQRFFNSLTESDIVYRTIIDGDICIVNRYPSIREESFCSRSVVVQDVLSFQFNLQTLEGHNVDFDGDEMEMFFIQNPKAQVEIALLSSVYRQFISHGTGKNMFGGTDTQDIDPGAFHLSKYEDFNPAELGVNIGKGNGKNAMSGLEILQTFIPSTISNFNNGIVIENGKITKISSELCSTKSEFLKYISFYYGQHTAVDLMDAMTKVMYNVNELCGSTLDPFICTNFMKNEQQKTIQANRIQNCNNVINQYYLGKLDSPVGLDPRDFMEQVLSAYFTRQELEQKDIAMTQLKNTDSKDYFNKLVDKHMDALASGIIQFGQVRDEKTNRITDPLRVLPCKYKYEVDCEAAGYIKHNYVYGLTAFDIFFEQISGRRQIYAKGNAVRDDGYTARLMSKGNDNVVIMFNGLVFGDNNTIVSYQYGSNGYDSRCFGYVPFKFHQLNDEELKSQFGTHPRFSEMQTICHNIQEVEKRLQTYTKDYTSFDKIYIPFQFRESSISSEQLDKLWRCRICEKMTMNLREIVYSQVFQFYIYALFFLKIDEKSTYNVVDDYLKCLVNPGEMVGLKAASACTQPYVQGTLKAIHVKRVSGIQYKREDKTTNGSKRFMELVIQKEGPITFQLELLGKQKFDEDANEAFVSQYQTHPFEILKPFIKVFYGPQPTLQIVVELEKLAFYNVNVKRLMEGLMYEYDVTKATIKQDKDNVVMQFSFSQQITINRIMTMKIQLHTKYKFGSQFIYNVYYEKVGPSYQVKGNLVEGKFSSLLKMRGINQQHVFINNPMEYYNVYGILKSQMSLYDMLQENLNQQNDTKEIQRCHIKTITDQLTQTGTYASFTRDSYKKQKHRDILQLATFEEPVYFFQKEVEQPKHNNMYTMLNAQIFGTRARGGTTLTKILVDREMLQSKDV